MLSVVILDSGRVFTTLYIEDRINSRVTALEWFSGEVQVVRMREPYCTPIHLVGGVIVVSERTSFE